MNKYLMSGIAALTLCAGFTSCSHDDFEPMTQAEIDKAKYDMAFLNYVGGKIAADQNWGFGSATRGLTRAGSVEVKTWAENHSDEWMGNLDFEEPTDYIEVTDGMNFESNKTYYVKKGFTGNFNFNNCNGATLYVADAITSGKGNGNDLNIYILEGGSWEYVDVSGCNRVKIYNKGNLLLENWSATNITEIYNGGTFQLGNKGYDPMIGGGVKFYSKGDATIEIIGLTGENNEVKFECECDIHGTLKVTGNLKIQTSTTKYICGIDATGKVENVNGPLKTSYINADKFAFDGNPLYLLPGGHVVANTIATINSGCNVHGYEGSVALVEATNFDFGNKNDFTHTFSENVYFKVNGGYVKVENCYAMGGQHNFASIEEYLAYDGHSASQSDEYQLAKDRINAGNATGSPACGEAWTVGTPTTPELRIIAEDLSADAADDFDFNDVVIDVKFGNPGVIEVKAAGGTLPLRICGNDEWEVHKLFRVDTDCMVNTGASAKGLKGQEDLTAAPLQLDFAVNSAADAKKIKIEVYKNDGWQELTAEEGKPAAKIAVDTTFDWLGERVSIKDAYKDFTEWVNGTFKSSKWW